MTVVESDILLIEKPIELVSQFLSNPENYKMLMPSSVTDFQVNGSVASMKLKGLGDLSLQIEPLTQPGKVRIIPAGKAPFDFFLEWDLKPAGAATQSGVRIEADLNMMMKMMAMGFLKDFVNSQVFKLKKHLESQE
jgi:carbon monoxide dehydrogenase subunit G